LGVDAAPQALHAVSKKPGQRATTLLLVNKSPARTVAAGASYRRSLAGGTHDWQVLVRFLLSFDAVSVWS
jgi:hypothetical protein